MQADEEQSYRSRTVKLVDLLVNSFNESIERERAMSEQFGAFLNQCTLFFQSQAAAAQAHETGAGLP
jgi:hypothetical protein